MTSLRAELGRSSWRLLHTMAARFPEHPTAGERNAYDSFVSARATRQAHTHRADLDTQLWLFSRLYPCGGAWSLICSPVLYR